MTRISCNQEMGVKGSSLVSVPLDELSPIDTAGSRSRSASYLGVQGIQMYPEALTGLEPWSLNSKFPVPSTPRTVQKKNGAVGRVGNTMVIMKVNTV